MSNRYYIHAIPMRELALYVAEKLNSILGRKECYRDGHFEPFPKITPEIILEKRPSREELEFYYERMCIDEP